MKDAEIMKALQCCTENNCTHDCPFYYDSCIKCRYSSSEIISLAFGLINRQKAEIERLEKHATETAENCTIVMKANDERNNRIFSEAIKVIETKAVKAFAERVKEELRANTDNNGDINSCFVPIIIDRLVKETDGAE